MRAPTGYVEELALERFTAAELERQADAHWQAGNYAPALAARREAVEAWQRVDELEAQVQS